MTEQTTQEMEAEFRRLAESLDRDPRNGPEARRLHELAVRLAELAVQLAAKDTIIKGLVEACEKVLRDVCEYCTCAEDTPDCSYPHDPNCMTVTMLRAAIAAAKEK